MSADVMIFLLSSKQRPWRSDGLVSHPIGWISQQRVPVAESASKIYGSNNGRGGWVQFHSIHVPPVVYPYDEGDERKLWTCY